MTPGAILQVDGVRKAFGGVVAVKDVSLTVRPGETLGIIGPNGSGKTTLFNVITGFLRPDAGTVTFKGRDVSGSRPHRVVRSGIGRTFQVVRPFDKMTIYENVKVGALMARGAGKDLDGRVRDIIRRIGLGGKEEECAGNLPIGDLKRLEVGRALSTGPDLLLLDEPFGGLTHGEAEGLRHTIEEVIANGMTLVIVEHVMRELMRLVDRLAVLDEGAKICEGPVSEVVKDPRVIQAYLGRARADDQ
jgi:branched-chain amino acid transport system ATP-binding protein